MIKINITPEAKKYYIENEKNPDCNFRRLSRVQVSTPSGVLIQYYLQEPETLFQRIQRCICCCTKQANTPEITTGRTLIQLYKDDLEFLPKQKFYRAVKKIIHLGIGKGLVQIEKQKLPVCLLQDDYWCETIIPQHYDRLLSRPLFHAWRDSHSSLNFENWLMSRESSDVFEDCRSEVDKISADFRKKPIIAEPDVKTGILQNKIDLSKIKINYLTPNQRKKYLVDFNISDSLETQLLDAESKPLVGTWIYVIDADKNIYAAIKETGVFQHSSFLSGAPVICAGTFETNEEGLIKWIDNNSGHYHSSPKSFSEALHIFDAKGLRIFNSFSIYSARKNSPLPSNFRIWLNPRLPWKEYYPPQIV